MKIIKKDLLDAVKVCNTIKNDGIVSLWDSLLFQCINGEALITGRSTTKVIHHRLKDDAGSTIEPFLFNGSLMAKLLKEFPDDMITINNDGIKVAISIGNSKFHLSHNGSDALKYIRSFPDCGEQKASASIPPYYITDYAKAWDKFPSRDDLRPVMSYICVELTDGAGYLVTTNAHILFRVKFEWHCEEPQTFLLPGVEVGKLCKLMPKQDIKISKYERDWMEMEVGSVRLLYYVSSDKYPNWRATIPVFDQKITFNAKELMAIVKLMHNFSNPSTHNMILEANGDGIYIQAHDLDEDNHATVQINASVFGDDIKIGFNTVQLQECLKQIKGKEVTMKYTKANGSVMFTGDESNDVITLLMPIEA